MNHPSAKCPRNRPLPSSSSSNPSPSQKIEDEGTKDEGRGRGSWPRSVQPLEVEALREPYHRSADAHIRTALSQVRQLADVGIRAPIYGQFMVPMHAKKRKEALNEPTSYLSIHDDNIAALDAGVQPGAGAKCSPYLYPV